MKKKGAVLSPGTLRLWRKEAEELAGGRSKKDRAERIFNALKEARTPHTREELLTVMAKNVRRRMKEKKQERKKRRERALAVFRGKIERRLARGIAPGQVARFPIGLDVTDTDVRKVRAEYNKKRGFLVTWEGHRHILGSYCVEGALVFRNKGVRYRRERFPKNCAMHVARV